MSSCNRESALCCASQVYSWVPQNDVLGHPSVAAFLTNCKTESMYEVLTDLLTIILGSIEVIVMFMSCSSAGVSYPTPLALMSVRVMRTVHSSLYGS